MADSSGSEGKRLDRLRAPGVFNGYRKELPLPAFTSETFGTVAWALRLIWSRKKHVSE